MLAPLGDAWKSVKETRFAVAVPLDEGGQPLVSETFPMHVYFPTDELPDLRVAVHAEWVLTMDRSPDLDAAHGYGKPLPRFLDTRPEATAVP